MTKTQYYDSLCEAAMCIWEHALENSEFMDWLRGDEGQAVARQMVIDYLAEHCEISYILAKEWGFDDSFDWEYVPKYCQALMRHMGKDGPSVAIEKYAVLIAKEIASWT